MAIRFYRVSEPYGCFSNFSPHPTTNDYYWGEGTKKTGKNMLGIILMEVRAALSMQKEYLKRIDEASSHMEADALANCPNPAVEYQREILRKLGKRLVK